MYCGLWEKTLFGPYVFFCWLQYLEWPPGKNCCATILLVRYPVLIIHPWYRPGVPACLADVTLAKQEVRSGSFSSSALWTRGRRWAENRADSSILGPVELIGRLQCRPGHNRSFKYTRRLTRLFSGTVCKNTVSQPVCCRRLCLQWRLQSI